MVFLLRGFPLTPAFAGAGSFFFFLFILLRGQNHHDLAAFEAGFGFDFADRIQFRADAFEEGLGDFLMGHFAATEAQGDFHLVAFGEERCGVLHFNAEIVVVDHRAELDFLQLDHFLLFAGFVGFLLKLVLVFAVVEDFADRRFGVGRDFDEVKPRFFGQGHAFAHGHHAAHFTVGVDDANLTGNDGAVDTGAVVFFTPWGIGAVPAGEGGASYGKISCQSYRGTGFLRGKKWDPRLCGDDVPFSVRGSGV